MTLKEQCEAWKTLALAYEVFVECAAEMHAQGLAAALRTVHETRDVLIDAGLMTDEIDEKPVA